MQQGARKAGEKGFAKGLWQTAVNSAMNLFMRPDAGIPSEAALAQG